MIYRGTKFVKKIKEISARQKDKSVEAWEERLLKEIQKEGIGETLQDFAWLLASLFWIKNKDGAVVRFIPNKVQLDFWRRRHFRNVIIKGRQMGVSTGEAIWLLAYALHKPGREVMVISHTDVDTKKILDKMKLAIQKLPKFMKGFLKISDNAGMIKLFFSKNPQDKEMTSVVTVGQSGMGGTLAAGHITELGYLDVNAPQKSDEVVRGTIPSVPDSGFLTIESTARGNVGNLYNIYKTASETPKSKKTFKKFFYSWRWDEAELNKITKEQIAFVCGGEGEEWNIFKKIKEQHKLSDREITYYYFLWEGLSRNWDLLKQEYPTTADEAFSTGDEFVFSSSALEKQKIISPVVSGSWEIFVEPNKNDVYVIGGDPSEGIGIDGSSAVVLNASTLEVCAVLWDKTLDPIGLANELIIMGNKYNKAYLAYERNKYGFAITHYIKDKYPLHLIHQEKSERGFLYEIPTAKFGWFTGNNKAKMVYDVSNAINMGEITINSAKLLEELSAYPKSEISFISGQKKKKTNNVNGSHFDRAMSLFIAFQCVPFALERCFNFERKKSPLAKFINKRR